MSRPRLYDGTERDRRLEAAKRYQRSAKGRATRLRRYREKALAAGRTLRRSPGMGDDPIKVHQTLRKGHLKERFGITPDVYDHLFSLQGGVCAICKEPPTERYFAIDHNHDTGRIRGLVHKNCNSILGLAHDNKALLRAAADYLEERD